MPTLYVSTIIFLTGLILGLMARFHICTPLHITINNKIIRAGKRIMDSVYEYYTIPCNSSCRCGSIYMIIPIYNGLELKTVSREFTDLKDLFKGVVC